MGATLSADPRSYVRSSPKSLARSKNRPKGQQYPGKKGSDRRAAPPSLDTEGTTQRVGPRSRHNSTDQRFRLVSSRVAWLDQLESLTSVVREQRARKLRERGRALALDRRRLWRESGLAERQERNGRPIADTEGGDETWELGQSKTLVAVEARAQARARGELAAGPSVERDPPSTQWHESRARNKINLFDRVASCGSEESTQITLVCGGCGEKTPIDVGCDARWFCARCRPRPVKKVQGDFRPKRTGLLTVAARVGLTRRRQRKGERWGERLLTLTLPHRGTPVERIRRLRKTRHRFFRLLRDELRAELERIPSGVFVDDLPAASTPRGVSQSRVERTGRELSLWEFFTYYSVLEWTPGEDGLGHPHFHVWMFSRFIAHDRLRELWQRAYFSVLRAECPIGPIEEVTLVIDVRAVHGDPSHELIKYLTKDWEVTPDGAHRALPEVYAQVYAECDGTRLRQSSAGFADWGVGKHRACPCCWHEGANGWARIEISHALEHHKDPIGVKPPDPSRDTRAPLAAASRATELRNEWEKQRDAEWAAGAALRVLRARVRKALGIAPKSEGSAQRQGGQLFLGERR